MKIKSLKLENFRGKAALNLTLGARLTLLMGINGSGKTTILDALAIGLGTIATQLPGVAGVSFKKQGEILERDHQKAPYARVSVETTTGLHWDRLQRRDQTLATARDIVPSYGTRQLEHFIEEAILTPLRSGEEVEIPVFAYYGVSRALLDLPKSRKGFPKQHSRFDALAGALNATSRFKSAFVWFYNKENEETRLQRDRRSFDVTLKELDAVRTAIKRMFDDVAEPQVTLNPLRFVVRHGGQQLDLDQLSDGYKTLLALVIDLSARMSMANPHLDDPLGVEAIVMIDEVDLHLHPAWQQHIIGDLLRTFPNTQFVLTTHSPFIVGSTNNYLKRFKIRTDLIEDLEISRLLPLDPKDVTAYAITESGEESLMDERRGLLDDRLLDCFNTMTRRYEYMRDIEWEERRS
jgi:predicted ATP-binding protein involved in virulence